MGSFDGIAAALRLLRESRGLERLDMPERGGPPAGTIAKIEIGLRPPDLKTLERFLDALGASVYDLADALAQVNGRAKQASQPRPEIVTALRGVGLSDDALIGAASMSAAWGVPRAEFVASVAEAARQRAQEIAERFEEPKP